ncbi:hypothetical protein Tco_0211046 [Tanacetum coccineum]
MDASSRSKRGNPSKASRNQKSRSKIVREGGAEVLPVEVPLEGLVVPVYPTTDEDDVDVVKKKKPEVKKMNKRVLRKTKKAVQRITNKENVKDFEGDDDIIVLEKERRFFFRYCYLLLLSFAIYGVLVL